jgi:hypothetical protein
MPFVLAQAPPLSPGTGLELMVIGSFVVPALLLVLILWLGSRNTV